MGQVAYFQKVASKLQHFYAGAVGAWINAIGLASSGNYTADMFASDLVANSANGVEALLSLLTDGGSPLVPTTSINESAATIKAKATSSTAYLDTPLKLPAAITWTSPLIRVGHGAVANPIDAHVAFTSAWGEEIRVSVRAHNRKAADPVPTTGIYVGGVFDPGGVLVANIVVKVR